MCGIAGVIGNNVDCGDDLISALDSMKNRGPDDSGAITVNTKREIRAWNRTKDYRYLFEDNQVKALLGHVRFSLVDLSARGCQPFIIDDPKICLVFNGEIFNYIEIKQELIANGVRFRTSSDTEVIGKAFSIWGVECFNRFVGFWSVIIYDRTTDRFLISRDRLGKAPLYYLHFNKNIYFASEIKALFQLVPDVSKTVNLESVYHFCNWLQRDFNNSTFYSNVVTFPAGCYAWVESNGELDITSYWQIPTLRKLPSEISIYEAREQFRFLINDATKIRARPDAPVAIQISGGLDSSSLLACLAKQNRNIDAYTIRYSYGAHNEEPFARMVANHYKENVNYHVIDSSEEDVTSSLFDYAANIFEPFHSPNQISSQKIWKKMSDKGIRGVIYGGGGDEVFAGYSSEYYGPYLNHLLQNGKPYLFLKEFLSCSEYQRTFPFKDYIKMGLRTLGGVKRKSTHGRIPFIPQEINPLILPEFNSVTKHIPPSSLSNKLDQNMKCWRMNYWLRQDNQNSMGIPIELRSPFLDHRLVEFSFSLPFEYLIRNVET